MKRDVGIAYIAMRKIHYNVMRFKETLSVDEAEVLAGRFKSISARYFSIFYYSRKICKDVEKENDGMTEKQGIDLTFTRTRYLKTWTFVKTTRQKQRIQSDTVLVPNRTW